MIDAAFRLAGVMCADESLIPLLQKREKGRGKRGGQEGRGQSHLLASDRKFRRCEKAIAGSRGGAKVQRSTRWKAAPFDGNLAGDNSVALATPCRSSRLRIPRVDVSRARARATIVSIKHRMFVSKRSTAEICIEARRELPFGVPVIRSCSSRCEPRVQKFEFARVRACSDSRGRLRRAFRNSRFIKREQTASRDQTWQDECPDGLRIVLNLSAAY